MLSPSSSQLGLQTMGTQLASSGYFNDQGYGLDDNPVAGFLGNIGAPGGEFGGMQYTQSLPWENLQQTAHMQDQFIQNAADARGQGYQNAINSIYAAYAPYAGLGGAASGQLTALLQNPYAIQNMPGYQAGLNAQMNAVENSAAAKGGLLSGNALNALRQGAASYMDQSYDKALGRALSAAQLGSGIDMGLAGQLADLNVGYGASNAQAWDRRSDYVNKHENAGMDQLKYWFQPTSWMGLGG